MVKQLWPLRRLLILAILACATLPAAHGACCCPYMHQMFGQMQQQQQMGYQRQMQMQQGMMQQQMMMQQRQMYQQQQMMTMRQSQMRMQMQTRMMTQMQGRMQTGLHTTAMHRTTMPTTFHVAWRPTGFRPGYTYPGFGMRHTVPGFQRTQVTARMHINTSMHTFQRRTTQVHVQMQHRQFTAQRRIQTATNRVQTAQRIVHTQRLRISDKPIVQTKTTAQFGVKMTCGNCHGCKQTPPAMTQTPVITMRPNSPMPCMNMNPPLRYQPPLPQLVMGRPTLRTPTMQMVPIRVTGMIPMTMAPARPTTGMMPMLGLILPQPTAYRPTPFDMAMSRLIPKSTGKITETSRDSTLVEASMAPTLPELTPFLPPTGGNAAATLEKSLASSRLPGLLIVPASAALLEAPLLPELPEHAEDAPPLPPLPAARSPLAHWDRRRS